MLLVHGLEAVFRISLVLLREHQEAILACCGFEETMQCLKTNLPDITVEKVAILFEMVSESTLCSGNVTDFIVIDF